MKRFRYWVGLAAAALLALAAAPASADPGYYLGHWVNNDQYTNNITRVVAEPNGYGQVKVRAFGACHPTDCDWGAVDGQYETGFWGDRLKMEYNSGFSITKLTLHRAPGDQVTYEAHTHFTDGSGRAPYDSTGSMHRWEGGGGGGGYGPPPGGGGGGYGPPGPPPGGGGGGGYGPPPGPTLGAEDCNDVDPGAVSASFQGGAWKVVQGTDWLLDYGSDSAGAHHAADLIHHYHFHQECFVKRPGPSMTYWKSGDHVPSGGTPGEDCIGLNPSNVMAAHQGGAWKVVDGTNWLLDYGSDHAAADKAASTIHYYNLNRMCFVVRSNMTMQYWLSQ